MVRRGMIISYMDLAPGKSDRLLVQRADGYSATLVNGGMVQRCGVATGVLPGRLVRGPQAVVH